MASAHLLQVLFLAVPLVFAQAVAQASPAEIHSYELTPGATAIPPNGICHELVSANALELHVYCNSTKLNIVDTFSPNTTKFTLMGSNITVLQKAPFQRLTYLRALVLRKNNIRYILSTAFTGLAHLVNLDLSNNLIRVLHPKSLEACPRLQELDLSSNFILHVQSVARAASVLPSLRYLSLKENKLLDAIAEDELVPLANTNLTNLDLSDCQLRLIHSSAFEPLETLTHLSLSYNPLTLTNLTVALSSLQNATLDIVELKGMGQLQQVPAAALAHLTSTGIKVLVLSENKFPNVYNGDFPRLHSLVELHMDKCEIEKLGHEAFINLTSLQKLYLQRNRMPWFPVTVSKLTDLRYLDLSFNEATLQKTAFLSDTPVFKNLTQLEELLLKEVNIPKLSRLSLYGLTNLKTLHLTGSKIGSIEDFTFETMQSLERLDLSYNSLSTITSDVFSGLTKLEHLNMIQTGLYLDSNVALFNHLHNLQVLDLRRNKLTVMPRSDLTSLTRLEMLLLNSNAIVPWQESVLPSNSSLRILILRENNMYTVTSAMQKDFARLEVLDVSGNPYNCSLCEVNAFGVWSNATAVDIHNKQETLCMNPKMDIGKTIFTQPLPNHCVSRQGQLIVVLVVIFSTLGLVLVAAVGTCYYFRWYLRYWWFLSQVKVKNMRDSSKSDSYRYDAFVSYNEKDRTWVAEHLLPKIENTDPKARLCLHERDFEVGREILHNIVESIDSSRKVVLLLSNNFLASQWCTWEMNMAQFKLVEDSRDAFVLILLEPIEKRKMSPSLRYLIRTRTYLEWTDNPQGQKLFWERLKHALQKPETKYQLTTLV